MNRSLTQRSRHVLTAVGLATMAFAASGCTTNQTIAQTRTSDTVPISPVVAGTMAPAVTLEPATTRATTEAPPTVTAPVVTDAAATTEVPTTTEAPTTSEAPTTTTEAPPPTSTLPANIEIVGSFPTPIAAIGSSSGPDTAVVQLRLLQLGFWNGGTDGKFGLTTKQAVMAFQKYLNLPATGSVDKNTATYLTALDTKAHGQADTGSLIEIDKGKQLLFVVVDGKTQWVFNTSTGTGNAFAEVDKNTPGGPLVTGVSITADGLWKVDRERPVGWWEGDLGQIYRPKYFHGGEAVHGSNSVPNYPASHGCVRVSTQAMDFIWAENLMPLKSVVWVHV